MRPTALITRVNSNPAISVSIRVKPFEPEIWLLICDSSFGDLTGASPPEVMNRCSFISLFSVVYLDAEQLRNHPFSDDERLVFR